MLNQTAPWYSNNKNLKGVVKLLEIKKKKKIEGEAEITEKNEKLTTMELASVYVYLYLRF